MNKCDPTDEKGEKCWIFVDRSIVDVIEKASPEEQKNRRDKRKQDGKDLEVHFGGAPLWRIIWKILKSQEFKFWTIFVEELWRFREVKE